MANSINILFEVEYGTWIIDSDDIATRHSPQQLLLISAYGRQLWR